MEDYPRTQMELERRFPDDEACRSYLESLRWPNGFICAKCGGRNFWRMKRGLLLCQGCRRQASVIAGTIFQDSRLPLTLWFRAMWHITNQKNGASALGIQRILGLGSYQTAWAWLQKLRRAMVRQGRDRIAGTIEVDETYIGGEKPGKRGRGAAGKALVLIAAQIDGKTIGRIRLQQIPNANSESLISSLHEMVEIGSVIQTDGWSGYLSLPQEGYEHKIVRGTEDVGEKPLPSCHRIASLLKRWLLGTHQGAVSHQHLAYYLDEFAFRFNRRTSRSRGKLFYRIAQQSVQVDPTPYTTLIHRKM